MIKSCFLKLVFCMVLFMGLSCSFASAEEVELNPTDYFTYTSHFQDNSHDVEIVTDTCVNTPVLNANGHYYERWIQGDFLTAGEAKVAYKTPAMTDSSHPALSFYDGNFYTNQYYYHWDGYDYIVPSSQLTFHDASITLDVSNLLAGWYRYEAEIYVGATFFGNVNGASFDPVFTYDSSEIPLGVNGKIYYAGTEDLTTGDYYNRMGTKLIHFHFEDTWLVDTEVDEYTWNITPAFQYLISSLQYSGGSNIRKFGVATNNRFQSKLYGSVDPIVSPTPVPTPYPGQDTQESINQGVSNIEGQMNQLINSLNPVVSPVPTPADFSIDETLFDELETMTLPDVSDAQTEYSALWDIFNPLWWFLGALFGCLFVIGIFLYVLRGGFI